jgi:hypothetical protein
LDLGAWQLVEYRGNRPLSMENKLKKLGLAYLVSKLRELGLFFVTRSSPEWCRIAASIA